MCLSIFDTVFFFYPIFWFYVRITNSRFGLAGYCFPHCCGLAEIVRGFLFAPLRFASPVHYWLSFLVVFVYESCKALYFLWSFLAVRSWISSFTTRYHFVEYSFGSLIGVAMASQAVGYIRNVHFSLHTRLLPSTSHTVLPRLLYAASRFPFFRNWSLSDESGEGAFVSIFLVFMAYCFFRSVFCCSFFRDATAFHFCFVVGQYIFVRAVAFTCSGLRLISIDCGSSFASLGTVSVECRLLYSFRRVPLVVVETIVFLLRLWRTWMTVVAFFVTLWWVSSFFF